MQTTTRLALLLAALALCVLFSGLRGIETGDLSVCGSGRVGVIRWIFLDRIWPPCATRLTCVTRREPNYVDVIGKGRGWRKVQIPPEFAPLIRALVEVDYPVIPEIFSMTGLTCGHWPDNRSHILIFDFRIMPIGIIQSIATNPETIQ